MSRKLSDGRGAFGVRGELSEPGRFIHDILFLRNDFRLVGVEFVEDHGPKPRRGDLRLLGKNILFEVIPQNSSKVNVLVMIYAPEKT